jgi:hypothetical protein
MIVLWAIYKTMAIDALQWWCRPQLELPAGLLANWGVSEPASKSAQGTDQLRSYHTAIPKY